MRKTKELMEYKNRFLSSMEALQHQLILLKDKKLTVDIALCVICSMKQIVQLTVQIVTYQGFHLETILLRNSNGKSATVDELMKYMQSSTNSLLSDFSLFNLQDVASNEEDGNKVHQVDDCDDMDTDGDVSNEINDAFDRLDKFSPSPLKMTNIQPLDVVSNPIEVFSNPLDIFLNPLDVVSNPLDVVSNPLDVVSNPLDVVSNPLDVVSNPLDVVSNPLDVVSNPLDIVSNQINDEKNGNEILVDQKTTENLHNYKISERDSKYNLKNCSVVLSRISPHQISEMQCYGREETRRKEASTEFKLNSEKRKFSFDGKPSDDEIDEPQLSKLRNPLKKVKNRTFSTNVLMDHLLDASQLIPGQKISSRLNFQSFQCFLCNNGEKFNRFKNLSEHMSQQHCMDSPDGSVLCCPESIKGCAWNSKIDGCVSRYKMAQICRHMISVHDVPIPSCIIPFQCKHCEYRKTEFRSIKTHSVQHLNCISCKDCGKKIGPSLEHEKPCSKVCANRKFLLAHRDRNIGPKQLLGLSDSDNNLHKSSSGSIECRLTDEMVSGPKASFEHGYENLNQVSCDTVNSEIVSVKYENSDVIDGHDSVSRTNSETNIVTAEGINCTQDVESSNHVSNFLATEVNYMSSSYLNFTTYQCFLCNNGQDFSKSRTLIKHVIGEHCYTSEISEELCLPCSVQSCCWEKSLPRKCATPAKVRLFDINYAYSVLFEHLVKYHNLPVPDYIKTIRCSYPQCRFECFRLESLDKHVSSHAAKVRCESCGLYFRCDIISRHLKKCASSKHGEATRGELHSSISRTTRANSVEARHVELRTGTNRNNSMGACQETLQMLDSSLKSRRPNKYAETTVQQSNTKFLPNYLNFLSYKCFLCNNEPDLKSYRQLCDHLSKEHCQQENNGELIFPCPKVGCTWQKITKKNNRKNRAFIKRCFCLVLKHLNVKHRMAVPTYVRWFQCRISHCKFRTVELDGLTQHMISHDKKITCGKCGRLLKAYRMKKHLERCPIMRKRNGGNSKEQLREIVENRSGDDESKIFSRDDFEEPLFSRPNQIEKRSDMHNDISIEFYDAEKPSIEVSPSYATETSPSVAIEAISGTDPTSGVMTVEDYDEDTEVEEHDSDEEIKIEKEEITMSHPSGKIESTFGMIPNKSVNTYQAAGDSRDPGYSESAFILQEELNHGALLRFKFYQCFVCVDNFTEFTDYSSLCRHIEQEHCLGLDDGRTEWKCPFCNYRQTFCRKLGRLKMMRLLNHMNVNHNFGIPSCIDPYACTVPGCSYKCLRRDELITSHRFVHEDRVPCEKCGKILRANNLKRHGMTCKQAERTQSSAKCSHCDKEFSSKWSLKSHMNSFHAEVKDHIKICTICSRQFTSNSSLLEHSVKAHNVNIADRPILTCPKCPFQSTIEGRLKKHFQNRHTETKSFVCTSCQKCFNSKCKLNAHVRQSHGERTYNCTKCDYTSSRLNNLNEHFKAQHTMNKFTCEICGYTTGYFANLCKHKRQSSCGLKLKESTLTS